MPRLRRNGPPMSASEIAKIAFDLYEKKQLSREKLVCVLKQCVNAAALDNGYADAYGLPFPNKTRKRRARRAP